MRILQIIIFMVFNSQIYLYLIFLIFYLFVQVHALYFFGMVLHKPFYRISCADNARAHKKNETGEYKTVADALLFL